MCHFIGYTSDTGNTLHIRNPPMMTGSITFKVLHARCQIPIPYNTMYILGPHIDTSRLSQCARHASAHDPYIWPQG